MVPPSSLKPNLSPHKIPWNFPLISRYQLWYKDWVYGAGGKIDKRDSLKSLIFKVFWEITQNSRWFRTLYNQFWNWSDPIKKNSGIEVTLSGAARWRSKMLKNEGFITCKSDATWILDISLPFIFNFLMMQMGLV